MAKAGLGEQVRSLARAAELSQGRADEEAVAEALRVTEQVDRRLAFSGNAAVVAIAGATGSGKSSLFNALVGSEAATTGVRRPTTSTALAAVWDKTDGRDTSELLSWLGIFDRHPVSNPEPRLDGLVLIDMPDHDSVQVLHRMEVDRLVKLVDTFIWVVDPQKYADAALHDQYLTPMASHAEVMVVALNHMDTVGAEERERMHTDLEALLESRGLAKARVMETSAVSGEGVDQLATHLASVIKTKKAASTRLGLDVVSAGENLAAETGEQPVPGVSAATVTRLSGELAEAAGVGLVSEAVKKAWRQRGSAATGWPVVSWLGRFRPDPLRRLHLDMLPGVGLGKKSKELEPAREQRTSLPRMGGVASARVDNAVRTIAREGSEGLPRGWADAVKEAALTDRALLADELDLAVSRADLGLDTGRGWWNVIRVLQWLILAAVIVGVGWLTVNWVLWYFHLPGLATPELREGIPLPTVLALGGVGAGIVLALFSRLFVELGARSKAAQAERAVRRSIERTTHAQVVAPVEAELARYAEVRELLDRIG